MANKIRDLAGYKLGKLIGTICVVDKNGKREWLFACECGRGKLTRLTVKQVNERETKKGLKLMCDLCKLDGMKRPHLSKKNNYE